MTKRDENMEWEEDAAYLASLPRITSYRVPEQYFEDLTARIQQSVFLDGLTQKESEDFVVPKGYFDTLTAQIQARVTVENIKATMPADGFQVPSNYFDQLQSNILSKTANASPSKAPVRKLWHTEAIKYVSAACFFIVAATTLFVNQQQNLKEDRKIELANEQLLYDIDESVIMEHVQESQTASTNSASTTEIENYILDNFSFTDLSTNL